MKSTREQFEEIWTVPPMVEWSENIGAYKPRIYTVESVEASVSYSARLDTFTRCQEMIASGERRNAEMVELLTEHQWEWQPYDEHYHRDGGYYCLECQSAQKEGHSAECRIYAAIKSNESEASK